MAANIHPTAQVAPEAEVGDGVEVGAYAVLGPDVQVGANTRIGPHAVIQGPASIGANNVIFQFASVGSAPQDKKYKGEPTRLEVRDRKVIRECVTLNRGTTKDQGVTRIGNDNLFMAYAHVAHDCQVAAAVGALMGLLMAFVAVTLKIEQVVAGIVFVLFGTGLSNFLFRQTFGIRGKPPRVPLLPGVEIPILSDIPYVGTILFGQNPVFYLTLLMVVTLWIAIDRTTWGLKTRATGELPSAADTAGANVTRRRYIATIIGAALAGLGGGFLTAGQLGLFLEGVIAGRGWVALALVIFARWWPGLAVIGALVFGLADAIQFRLQALAPAEVPYEVFLMLPYAMTIG